MWQATVRKRLSRLAGWLVCMVLWAVACGGGSRAALETAGQATSAPAVPGPALPMVHICADSRWEIDRPTTDSAIYRCSKEVPASEWQSAVRTTAPTAFSADSLGRGLKTLAFVVDDMGGELRWNDPAPGQSVKAALLTHSGGGGNTWNDMLFRPLESDGVRIIGVRWDDGVPASRPRGPLGTQVMSGWVTRKGSAGTSFLEASRRVAAVMRWVHDNLVPAGTKFGTAGGSGGAIATFAPVFWHGLDDIIDYQFLTGGPVATFDINAACQGRSPDGVSERDPDNPQPTDKLHYPVNNPAQVGFILETIDYIFASGNDCQQGRYRQEFDQSSFRFTGGDWWFDHPIDFEIAIGGGAQDDATLGIVWQVGKIYQQLRSPKKQWLLVTGAPHGGSFGVPDLRPAMFDRIRQGLGLK